VLLGAWGGRAGELLPEGRYREGRLAMAGAPDGSEGDWCCGLFGEPGAGAGSVSGKAPAGAGRMSGRALADALAGALARNGEGALAMMLWGRFAAVAHDRSGDRCWVVRDRLGAHPVVHTGVAGGVLFAEHERDLLAVLRATPAPDRLAVLGWLESGMPPPGRTLYEGIERVPPGGRLALGEGVAVERWWEPRYGGVEGGTRAELGERLREAAFAAVARAAAGAGRPAVRLSGGLDSSCVAAGLAAGGFAGGGAVALGGTFAAQPEADEGALIEATAGRTGLRLELVPHEPGRSMLEPALAHVERWRLPPGSPTLFLWRPLLARARELGVEALLDGEGGDEVFGFAPYVIADRLRGGRWLRAWSLTAGVPGMGAYGEGRLGARLRVLRHYGLRPLVPDPIRRRRAQARARSAPAALISAADRAALAALREEAAERPGEGPVWWRMQAHALIGMREELDMAGHFAREAADAGLAIRHPLLHDLDLVETALALPPEAQFDASRDRPLLRDALRGLIPEEVRTRHAKSHFTELVLAGIGREEGELIEPLRRPDAPLRGYVGAAALERWLALTPADRPLLGAGLLWRLAIANRWLLAQADTLPVQSP